MINLPDLARKTAEQVIKELGLIGLEPMIEPTILSCIQEAVEEKDEALGKIEKICETVAIPYKIREIEKVLVDSLATESRPPKEPEPWSNKGRQK